MNSSPPTPKASYKFGFATDIGRKRAQNQDSGLALPEAGLFLVADGMGGHRGGETASQLAVDTIQEVVLRNQATGAWNARQTLFEAIQSANRAIYKRSQEEPELQGMGTTVTALLFHPPEPGAQGVRLVIGHVGDSRCYFVRGQQMWQITRDHSLVQEKFRAGLITRDELKTDQMKNVITRSVGFEAHANIDLYEFDAGPEDLFLICSDGLSSQVDDPVILQTLKSALPLSEGHYQEPVVRLIQSANETGGPDNITAILIQCGLASSAVSP